MVAEIENLNNIKEKFNEEIFNLTTKKCEECAKRSEVERHMAKELDKKEKEIMTLSKDLR